MHDPEALVEDIVCQCLQAREHRDHAAIERLLAAQPPDIREQVSAMLGTLDRVGLAGEATPAPTDVRALPFGPYLLLERLGAGTMGVVYRARDPGGTERALKLLQPGLLPVRRARLRFEREIQALRELSHPGICPILDAGEVDGVPFLVMPLLRGESLHAIFAMGPARDVTSQERLLIIVEQIAKALHHAHEHGFVHRDVKPANILVDSDDRPVVLDFGLARLDRDDAATLSQSHEVIGAPAYMAPEQIADGSNVDRRADVYALGVLLYEGLTGHCPYEAATRESLYRRILTGDAEPPSRQIADLPAALDVVCLTALAREPNRRYQSAADLAADLARVRAGQRPLAQLPGLIERTHRWIRRNPLPTTLVALLVLAVAGVLWQTIQERHVSTRDRARVLAAEAFDVLPSDPRRAEELGMQAQTLAPDVLVSLTAIEAARVAQRGELVLSGHQQPVTDLEFTANGQRLVSAAQDGTARIWTLRTGAAVELPHGGDGPAHASCQPGGDIVVTGGRSDGRLCAWRMQDGAQVWVHQALPDNHAVRVLRWSPDGRWLLAGGVGGAWLWSAAGERRELATTPAAVTAAAWLGDDQVAIGSGPIGEGGVAGSHWLRTYRVSAGSIVPVGSSDIDDGIKSLHPRPGAYESTGELPTVLVVGTSKTAYTWRIDSHPRALPTAQARGVHVAGWTADGDRAVTLALGGVLAVWSLPNEIPRKLQTVWLSEGFVPHPRDAYAAVSGALGVVQLRSYDGGGALVLGRRLLRPLPIAFSPDGQWLAACDRDHAIRIWPMWRREYPLFFAGETIHAAVWNEEGTKVVTASHRPWSNSRSGTSIVRTWDCTTGEPIRDRPPLELNGRVTKLLCDGLHKHLIALLADLDLGHICGVGRPDGTLHRNDELRAGQLLRGGVDGQVLADGKMVAVDENGGAFLYDIATGTIVQQLPVVAPHADSTRIDQLLAVAAKPDGSSLWCGGASGYLHRFDRRADGSYAEAPATPLGFIRVLEYVSDGSLLVGLANGSLKRLLRDGVVIEFQGHRADVFDLDWTSANGELLVASGDNAGSVRLWRGDGALIREIRAHTSTVYSVRFSPQGDRLLTGSADGTARIWPVVLDLGR